MHRSSIRKLLILGLVLYGITAGRAVAGPEPGDGRWSLELASRPELPPVETPSWGYNPIDRFVQGRFESRGLVPSPEADRRTLIRRVSFDLLGLPPSVDEVDAFLSDRSADAYERLVDRCLESPQ